MAGPQEYVFLKVEATRLHGWMTGDERMPQTATTSSGGSSPASTQATLRPNCQALSHPPIPPRWTIPITMPLGRNRTFWMKMKQ